MKVLLVYPEYPITFWSYKYALRFVSKKAAFPPLGLMTIASMLPKVWDIRLVDTNVTALTDQDIAWSDMVLISAMIIQKKSVEGIIRRCKDKKIVAGGPLFLNDRIPGVDHFVLNEAEITLPMFLADLEKGELKHTYETTDRPDVTKTPIPMWSLINMKNYNTMPIQYSRGCPFNCEFCDIVIMNGRIPRTKAPEQVIAEIQSLYDQGWKGSIFIVDDNFIGNKAKAKVLLRDIISWQKRHRYPFQLFTEASTNLAADPELMQLMSMANFNKVFLGIETPDIDSLKECGKFQNTIDDLTESIKIIQANGMQVMGGFIVGFDNDKESIFDAQINFIQKIGVVTAMVGVLNALPQTRLWHRLKAQGRLTETTTGENCELNFIPTMGKHKLIEGYNKIISGIYSYKNYYKRINVFLKNYKPTVKSHLRSQDIKAFLRSALWIGILSRAWYRYWWLIIKTTLTKRKSFPVAIELAISGLHYQKITKRILFSANIG